MSEAIKKFYKLADALEKDFSKELEWNFSIVGGIFAEDFVQDKVQPCGSDGCAIGLARVIGLFRDEEQVTDELEAEGYTVNETEGSSLFAVFYDSKIYGKDYDDVTPQDVAIKLRQWCDTYCRDHDIVL